MICSVLLLRPHLKGQQLSIQNTTKYLSRFLTLLTQQKYSPASASAYRRLRLTSSVMLEWSTKLSGHYCNSPSMAKMKTHSKTSFRSWALTVLSGNISDKSEHSNDHRVANINTSKYPRIKQHTIHLLLLNLFAHRSTKFPVRLQLPK